MTRIELIEAIRELPTKERLEVIEAAIHTLQEDLQPSLQDEHKQHMARAAEALLKDYEDDRELTCFTALDGEAFHEQRVLIR